MQSTLSIFSIFALAFFFTSIFAQYPQSPKRGLVSVSTGNPGDDQLFIKPNNGLTWYYNYDMTPTPEYTNLTQSDIEFVPMLWGASNTTGSSFLHNVTSLISQGRNITHVLSFNEPDVNYTAGGSQVSPELAAASWVLNFDPLRKMGIKVGAPVVYANASGFTWLDHFYDACKNHSSNCTADFMNIHIFGNISYVESYLDEYKQKYPGIPLWITEFALSYSPLIATEQFFNQSLAAFDNDTSVQRYSYFGAFRSSASNVGWNASMLDGTGKLTDIGSWYLGGGEVANTSTTTAPASTGTSSAKNSGAILLRGGEMLGSVVMVVVGVAFGMLFC